MTHLSRIFKITLATVLRNHAGILVQPQQIPDTIEEVRQVLKEAGYIATLKIATGLHLAYLEYKPLLLEGPPGTGKTFLAQTVAKARGLPIIRIQCYEGITFESLIGHWNFQKQVLAIRAKDETQLQNVYTPEFFRKGPLFSAFAKKGEDNVLLIDEFDKADDVFEYFFTEYLDERQLSTPELGTIKQQNKSYVFIT